MGPNSASCPARDDRGSGRRTWRPSWELVGLGAAIVVFLCAATGFALQVPAFHGTDERAHLGYAHAIAGGRLPAIDDRPDIPAAATVWRDVVENDSRTDSYRTVWVANHPPLHYMLVTPLIWLSKATDRTDGGLMFMRLANIAFAGVGIVFTYLLTVQLTGGTRRLGLIAASVVALLPRGHYEFAQGLNDGLAFAATTAVAWAAVRYLRLGHSAGRLLLLGGTVAVAAGTRAAAMLAAGAVVATVSIVRLVTVPGPVRGRAQAAVRTALGGLAPAVVLLGWFYLRNVRRYGDIGASGYLVERFDRTPTGSPLDVFLRGRMWLRIYQQLPITSLLPIRATPKAKLAANVAAVLATVGLVVCAIGRRRGGGRRARSCALSVPAFAVCLVVVLAVATSIAQHASGGGVATSRYLFPALGVLAGLVTIGLDRVTRLLPLIAVATLAVWSAHVLPSRIATEIDEGGATPTSLNAAGAAVLTSVSVAGVAVLIAVLLGTTIRSLGRAR